MSILKVICPRQKKSALTTVRKRRIFSTNLHSMQFLAQGTVPFKLTEVLHFTILDIAVIQKQIRRSTHNAPSVDFNWLECLCHFSHFQPGRQVYAVLSSMCQEGEKVCVILIKDWTLVRAVFYDKDGRNAVYSRVSTAHLRTVTNSYFLVYIQVRDRDAVPFLDALASCDIMRFGVEHKLRIGQVRSILATQWGLASRNVLSLAFAVCGCKLA